MSKAARDYLISKSINPRYTRKVLLTMQKARITVIRHNGTDVFIFVNKLKELFQMPKQSKTIIEGMYITNAKFHETGIGATIV